MEIGDLEESHHDNISATSYLAIIISNLISNE
jgi:hypothetical protein